MTGIPKKNENSVATKREAPIKIDPRIVAPERMFREQVPRLGITQQEELFGT